MGYGCLWTQWPEPSTSNMQLKLWEGEPPNDNENNHDDVIKWKPFPRYWPFVRGIQRSPVNSPHKGQWRGALVFSLKWLSKQSWGCWFDTPSRSLWRHRNGLSTHRSRSLHDCHGWQARGSPRPSDAGTIPVAYICFNGGNKLSNKSKIVQLPYKRIQ